MSARAFRVLGGITLVALPIPVGAHGPAAGEGAGADTAAATPAMGAMPASRPARQARELTFRLSVPGASATGSYRGVRPGPARVEPAPVRAEPVQVEPAPVRVEPVQVEPAPVRVEPAPARLAISLTVTGRTRCGILQLTTNGPADGVEWYTLGALCKPGTATFRAEASRLPWSSGALPSLRLCNGLRLALAEGDDCDAYEPPAGA